MEFLLENRKISMFKRQIKIYIITSHYFCVVVIYQSNFFFPSLITWKTLKLGIQMRQLYIMNLPIYQHDS